MKKRVLKWIIVIQVLTWRNQGLRDTDQPEDPIGSSRIGACKSMITYSIQTIHDGYADCLIRLCISISIASLLQVFFRLLDIRRHGMCWLKNQEQELKVLKQNYEKWLSPRMSNSHGKPLEVGSNTPNWNTPRARNRATNRLSKEIPFIVGQGDCRTGVL